MAVSPTRYYTKSDLAVSTSSNWLWVVGGGYSWLVEWDRHYLGPEIYSLTRLQGEEDFTKKEYQEIRPFEYLEVLCQLQKYTTGLANALNPRQEPFTLT